MAKYTEQFKLAVVEEYESGELDRGAWRSATWISQRRQRMRRRYSARVIQAINALMLEQAPGVVPKSLLGKGFTYLREQWPKLIRYTENGSWPISNNPCENAIRPFCVGRRGVFSDTVDDYEVLLPWKMPLDLR